MTDTSQNSPFQTDELDNLMTAAEKPVGFVVDYISPNMAYKPTWWSGAGPLLGPGPEVTLEDTGDHATYKIPAAAGGDQVVLDLIHGKLTNEDVVRAGLDAGFQAAVGPNASAHPVIRVDGVIQTEDPPFDPTSPADYSVDFYTGRVTFHTPLAGTETVTMYAGLAGVWDLIIQPGVGTLLQILQGEVQMSANLDPQDTMWTDIEVTDDGGETWTLDVFPNGIPKRETNKSIQDIVNRSYGNYSPLPQLGSGNGRGTVGQVLQLPFTFPKVQVLDENHRFHVHLEANTEAKSTDANPSFCTVTLKTDTLAAS